MTYSNLEKEELLVILTEMQKQLNEMKEKVADLIIIDEVTNLYNRKILYKTLSYETKRSIRGYGHLSVILFSINNFDGIQEKYGEEISNILLRQVGEFLLNTIRSIDILGVYDRNEFMLILPDMNPKKGWVAAERIQKLIDKEIFPVDNRVSLSVGLKHYEGEPINKLIEITERNLHLAKKEYARQK